MKIISQGSKKSMSRVLSYLLCAVVLLPLMLAPTVSALSPEQKALYEKNILYYDLGCSGVSGSSAPSGPINSVYMVGDSITEGAKNSYGLQDKFQSNDIDATISATGGSSITYSAAGRSGLEWVQHDKEKIADVDAVIIAHGTNHDPSDLQEPLTDIVSKIKNYNDSASLFWVNTATDSQTDPNPGGERPYTAESSRKKNDIIERSASQQGYKVIDIASANIPLAGDGIHPAYSAAGHGKWGDVVVEGVAGGDIATGAPSECCAAGSTILAGNSNEEKIWNYLVGEMGFNDAQAAGIMGNIQQESNFDPNAAYVGPINSDAFGIIQWVGGRRAELESFAANQGKPANDLGVQLDFMKKELEGAYRDSVYEPILAAGSMDEALLIWLEAYEAPCSVGQCGHEVAIRTPFAQDWLDKFGGSGGGGTSGCPDSSEGSVSGDVSELAQQLLDLDDRGKVEIDDYYSEDSASDEADRSTPRKQLEDLADGKQAKGSTRCGHDNGQIKPDAKILQFLVDLGGETKYSINSLFGQCHSPTSLHYQGTAVDFGCNHNIIGTADRIGPEYGVKRNFETCGSHGHWHYSIGGG
jgi:lysophospholipase L1-like esterase